MTGGLDTTLLVSAFHICYAVWSCAGCGGQFMNELDIPLKVLEKPEKTLMMKIIHHCFYVNNRHNEAVYEQN